MRKTIIFCLRMYQIAVSPYWPSFCRHVPSCSQYAREAIDTYGVIPGGWLTARRMFRCQPWGSKGYDPVPKLGE